MAKRGAVGPAAITLIVLDVLLIAALVVIMATWPDAGASEEPSPTSTAGSPSPTQDASPAEGEETTQAEAVEVPEDALDVASFIMPSQNIWCELGEDSAQCVIEEFSFATPSLEDCSEDVAGHVWQVTADQAGPVCPGDSVPEPPEGLTELAYGDATAAGGFLCESTRDGVTCRAVATGHGFEIARGGTRSF